MAQVFISYSRTDRNFVRQLHDALTKVHRDTWVDWEDIPLTAEWLNEIHAGIEAADNFIFVISPESVASAACQEELAYAAANHKRLLPVLRRTVPHNHIPESLAKINFIFFRESDDFETTFASLMEAIDSDLDWKRAHSRLLVRAKEWEQSAQDKSFLLHGRDLVKAEQWLTERADEEPLPTEIQNRYVLASRRSATKRQSIMLAAVTTALVVTVILSLVAWSQKTIAEQETTIAENRREEAERATASKNEALEKAKKDRDYARQQQRFAEDQRQIARARELVSTSALSQDADPEVSVLIAANAVSATWPDVLPEAVTQLHRAITASHARLTLTGHTGRVASVAWSPDGKRLASGSSDGTVRVWDAVTGIQVLVLGGHSPAITSVAWSPDGRRLASGSQDLADEEFDFNKQQKFYVGTHTSEVKVWDAEKGGRPLLALSGHTRNVTDVKWSPDGTRLASASDDRTVRIWDAGTGKVLLTLNDKSWVTALTWSPDGKRLAFGGDYVKVWDSTSGKELLNLASLSNADVLSYVRAIAWSPDGKRLAMCNEHRVAVYDAASGRKSVSIEAGSVSLAWSPDGSRLATGSERKFDRKEVLAKVWNAATGAYLLSLGGQSGSVLSVAWSPDGNNLATGSSDQTIKVWHLGDETEVMNLSADRLTIIDSIAWSPDGKRLAMGVAMEGVAGQVGQGEMASLPGTATTLQIADNEQGQPSSGGGTATTVQVADNGQSVFTMPRLGPPSAGAAKVWDVSSGKEQRTLPHGDRVVAVAWSFDGKRLATGSRDGTTKVWDAETGRRLRTLPTHDLRHAENLIWAGDGNRLATGLHVWDLRNGKEEMGAFIPPSGYQKAVLSPDWERLITTGSKSVSHRRSAFSSVISDLPNVKVWDRRTGREIYALDGELAYTAANSKGIAWCPDGTKLAIASSYLPSATGSFTGLTATVVDARSGKVLFTLKGHTRAVVSVAWSRDGKRLATGSDDRTVKVWDTGNGKELMTLSSGSQPIVGLAWSPDGKRLAAAHQFGAVEIYAVDVQILMVLARQHITAHPSEEGCQTYFHDKCPSFPHLSISKAVEGH